ncbi:MAG: cheB, two-component system, chemotaxis family, response regulator CheB [Prosthecobacter sp.]|nr:cheB, two-component system, chemotaxis family, response regulator CheB [Prosthecobacter sp.]
MVQHLVVIGASTGGLSAMKRLVPLLPGKLDYAVLVVIHSHPKSPMLMDRILRAAGDLPVTYAQDNEDIERGHVYLAPPDRHLLVHGDKMRVLRGPTENSHRPAVDALFRTAAASHGAKVIAVILTGYLDDGSSGAEAVKLAGGRIIVQDPSDAEAAEMPQSVLRHVGADYSGPVEQLPRFITSCLHEGRAAAVPKTQLEEVLLEAESSAVAGNTEEHMNKLGELTTMICPECHGPLWKVNSKILRFRCHIGHAYTSAHLLQDQDRELEEALSGALRVLRDGENLSTAMAAKAAEMGQAESRDAHVRRSERLRDLSSKVEELLTVPS